MNTRTYILAALATAGALTASAQAPVARAVVAPASNAAPAAVLATFIVDEVSKEVEMAGRDGDTLFYRARGASSTASTSIKLDTITSGDFDLKYEEDAMNRALVAGNWPAVADLLVPVVTPVLPYLDIKGNSAAELALQAGLAIMKGADALARGPNPDKARLTDLYQRARTILRAVGTAEWSPIAEVGNLRAILCLVANNDLKLAAKELEGARVPEGGDAAYGLYWLVQAHLRYARGNPRSAMNAAVKSIVFENKDIDTFPDALLLTARCYEDLLEWYRARDVYYEIAKLFAQTDWGKLSRERLAAIREKGVTKTKETIPIEVIFFGLDEDVNAKVQELLDGPEQKVDSVTDEDVVKEEPVIEEKKKTDDDAPPPDEGPEKPPSEPAK